MRHYQICVQCVMDTSDPKIVFDGKGVCDHCNTFHNVTLPNWPTGSDRERELRRLVEDVKTSGRSKEFDCIIGLSGGADSSYLAYMARELGFRPLLLHVDTGWNSPEAVDNIERLVEQLDFRLETVVIDWDEMRDVQLAFIKSGVPHIDAPQDHAIFATIYRYAERHGIRRVLTGANLATECVRNPVDWMYYQSDSTQLRDIHKRFGTRPLVHFPTTSVLWHKVYLPHIRGIRIVRPLNYVDYIKHEAIRTLQDELGWRPYPQKHFESRFTRFYEGYWLVEKFGYDVRRVQFSSLILTGQMERGDALEKLRHPPYDKADVELDLAFVAERLQISRDELLSHLRGPNRSFRDYRSQAWLYELGAKIMKSLRLEIGGKR